MILKFTDVIYSHPDGENLFSGINFSVSKKITALVGNNGSGKSTIFKLINEELFQSAGFISRPTKIFLMPQNLDQFSEQTLGETLGVNDKIEALDRITNGSFNDSDYEILDDDWSIELETKKILQKLNFNWDDLERKLETFSGGEVNKILFSSLLFSKPDLVLLDEPTNNLDLNSRKFIYDFLQNFSGKVFLISHDVELLNLAEEIIELNNGKIKTYGGNYNFYNNERDKQKANLEKQFADKNKELKNLKVQSEIQNQKSNKSQSYGKNFADRTGMSKMMANARKENSENSSSTKAKLNQQKIEKKKSEITQLQDELFKDRTLKIDFFEKPKTNNRILIKCSEFVPFYKKNLWEHLLDFEIFSSDRILLTGDNGSGKTSFVNSIIGKNTSHKGNIRRMTKNIKILDQDFLHLDEEKTILESMLEASDNLIPEHELRIRLGRSLFYGDEVYKTIGQLSGGEKVRISLLKLFLSEIPDLLILDEPTNNLDLLGINQLSETLKSYKGALLVISHDLHFIKSMDISKTLQIDRLKKHSIKYNLNLNPS